LATCDFQPSEFSRIIQRSPAFLGERVASNSGGLVRTTQLHRKDTEQCPFDNLPEPKGGRWGEGLTAEKMKECRWLNPVLVGELEFVEWRPKRRYGRVGRRALSHPSLQFFTFD
jgi:hypothetical protein